MANIDELRAIPIEDYWTIPMETLGECVASFTSEPRRQLAATVMQARAIQKASEGTTKATWALAVATWVLVVANIILAFVVR